MRSISMRWSVTWAVLGALLLHGARASARLELPQPSPSAMLGQRVGLTDLTLRYSRPAVRKRRIWGGLVPFGQLWRTGANACTRLTLSRGARIAGGEVPAGSYCLLTIPDRRRWTVILSKDSKLAGTRGYKRELDQLRVQVAPGRAAFRERLTFLFTRVTDDGARLDLEWERLRLSLPIVVETRKHAAEAIKAAIGDSARSHAAAAHYLLETKQRFGTALRLVERAIQIDDNWYANFVRARLLRGLGRHAEAYAALTKAKQQGDKARFFFWRDRVERALKTWTRK